MNQNELYNYGVKGMQWGRRKKQTQTSLGYRYHMRGANASQRDADELRKHGYKAEADAVQKQADKARRKAEASQQRYEQKVNTKSAKKTAKAQAKVDKLQTKRDKYKKTMQSEIDSFKGYENGIYDKKGNMLLSPKDVADCKRALADTMNKNLSSMDKQINRAKQVIG